MPSLSEKIFRFAVAQDEPDTSAANVLGEAGFDVSDIPALSVTRGQSPDIIAAVRAEELEMAIVDGRAWQAFKQAAVKERDPNRVNAFASVKAETGEDFVLISRQGNWTDEVQADIGREMVRRVREASANLALA